MEGCFEAWDELIAYHDLLFCMLEKGSLLIFKLLEPNDLQNAEEGQWFKTPL